MKKRLKRQWMRWLIKVKQSNYRALFKQYWFIAAVLLVYPTGIVSATSREQLQALEARIREVQTQILNTRTEYGRLQRQLQDREENIGKVAERLEQLHSELGDKKNTLTDLEKQEKQQSALLSKQRQVLAQQIRAAYIMEQQNYFKLLLNQENPVVVGRVLIYYDYFNRARLQQVSAIKTTVSHLQTLKQRMQQETETLNRLVTQQTDRETQISLSRQERQTILDQLALSLESQDKELKRLQEDKRQLQALLGTLESTLKEVPQEAQITFSELKGHLSYPLQGKIFKRFGEQLVSGLQWQGLLIEAPLGAKVQTIASGRVAFAEWFPNLGLLVIVDHGKGFMSLYAHNQSVYIEAGDWVTAGEVIASVGNSGGRHVPALYFEIRQQGIPIDPLKWLKH